MSNRPFRNSYRINSKSEKIFACKLSEEYFKIQELVKHQYKIDYIVELLEDENPTGLFFKVELKGIEKQHGKKDYLSYPFETEALSYYYKNLLLPVFVVIIDVRYEKGFWLFTQKYISENLTQENLSQKTVTLHIPKSQKLENLELFIANIKLAHRYMRDIRSTSIPDAINYTKKELESLDNRFKVNITYANDLTNIHLKANEKINPQFSIKPEYKKEFVQKIKNVTELGATEELDLKSMKLLGSPIFDIFNLKADKLLVHPHEKEVNCTIKTIDKDGHINTILSEIKGKLTYALKQNQYIGYLGDSLFRFIITVKRSEDLERTTEKYQFTFNYDKWSNKNINKLPYFQKIFSFCLDCTIGMKLEIELEEKGEVINDFSIDISQIRDTIKLNTLFLSTLAKAQEIFNYLKKEIYLPKPNKTSFDDLRNVIIVYDILSKGFYEDNIYKFEDKLKIGNNEFTSTLLNHLESPSEDRELFYDSNEGFKIFGYVINLGNVHFQILNPEILNSIEEVEDLLNNKEINEFELKWRGKENSIMRVTSSE